MQPSRNRRIITECSIAIRPPPLHRTSRSSRRKISKAVARSSQWPVTSALFLSKARSATRFHFLPPLRVEAGTTAATSLAWEDEGRERDMVEKITEVDQSGGLYL